MSGTLAADDAVTEQARLFETPGTAWYAIKHGDLKDVMKVWPPRKCRHAHHRRPPQTARTPPAVMQPLLRR